MGEIKGLEEGLGVFLEEGMTTGLGGKRLFGSGQGFLFGKRNPHEGMVTQVTLTAPRSSFGEPASGVQLEEGPPREGTVKPVKPSFNEFGGVTPSGGFLNQLHHHAQ